MFSLNKNFPDEFTRAKEIVSNDNPSQREMDELSAIGHYTKNPELIDFLIEYDAGCDGDELTMGIIGNKNLTHEHYHQLFLDNIDDWYIMDCLSEKGVLSQDEYMFYLSLYMDITPPQEHITHDIAMILLNGNHKQKVAAYSCGFEDVNKYGVDDPALYEALVSNGTITLDEIEHSLELGLSMSLTSPNITPELLEKYAHVHFNSALRNEHVTEKIVAQAIPLGASHFFTGQFNRDIMTFPHLDPYEVRRILLDNGHSDRLSRQWLYCVFRDNDEFIKSVIDSRDNDLLVDIVTMGGMSTENLRSLCLSNPEAMSHMVRNRELCNGNIAMEGDRGVRIAFARARWSYNFHPELVKERDDDITLAVLDKSSLDDTPLSMVHPDAFSWLMNQGDHEKKLIIDSGILDEENSQFQELLNDPSPDVRNHALKWLEEDE